MGNTDEARECYQKAVDIKPDYFKAWNNLGTIHLKDNNYDDAAECFQNAIDSAQEDDPIGWINLGTALLKLGEYGEALDSVDNAMGLNINTALEAEALYLKAQVFVATNQTAAAHEAFKHLLEIAPNHSNAYEFYYFVATYLDNSGHSGKALPLIKQSIELNPNHIPALQTLGCVLIHLKQHADAIPYLLKVQQAKPGNWEAIYNLACAYAGLDNEETNAKNYLKKALELVPLQINLKEHIKNDPDWDAHKNKNWFKEL